MDVHREMLVRSQVINDAAALLAKNHVSIKSAGSSGFEIANPCDRLPTEWVHIGVIPHCEGNVAAVLGKHDAPPTTYIKKRQRKKFPAPDLTHHSPTDRSATILAAEAKSLLNSGVQEFELVAECFFVNRSHPSFSGLRRHRVAVGRSRRAIMPTSANVASEMFSVTGLKAAVRYAGALIATTGIPASIRTSVSHSGQVRRHSRIIRKAKDTSTTPARVAAACRL